MVFYKILIFCVVLNVFVDFIESIPTFGEEFVHIKVHVPSDPSSSHGYMQPKQESESSKLHHTAHKVIHHYHRRRRPIKKLPKIEADPLFENVLLAELDNPSKGHTSQHEAKHNILPPIDETYVVKEEHHVKPAITKVNTYTVVEETIKKPNYNHYQETRQPHREYGKGNIETFRIIEEHKAKKQYQPKHVETVKLIEEKPYYPQRQHIAKEEKHTNCEYHIPQKTKYNLSYEATQANKEEVVDEVDNYYPQPHISQDDYEYYKSPQQGFSEIQKSPFKIYQGQDYFEKPLTETIGIIKTKKPDKYLYEFEDDDAIHIEETQYSKPKDEYYHHRETPEENHYHFNKQSSHSLGNLENDETGYRYHAPSTLLHQSSYETQDHQNYIPTPTAERKPQFKPSPSYAQFEERPHYEVSHKYSNDVQLQFPATENPIDFHSSSYDNFEKLASPAMAQNSLYDDLGTSSVYRPGTAEETYTGYDSYSAAHVQGLGSGGYKFPITYS